MKAVQSNKLGNDSVHFPDLCPAVSKPLIKIIVESLPPAPALILSVGCGSGLLEAMCLEGGKALNLHGVEVPDCHVKYLPDTSVLRVASTSSVHEKAVLATAVMFCYPRKSELVARYLDVCTGGALEQLLWFGHRSDWPEMEMLLLVAFCKVESIDGPGMADSELIAIATMPRGRSGPRE